MADRATFDAQLDRLEARPARYDAGQAAARMREIQQAIAIGSLSGDPDIGHARRLLDLYASGRISMREYLSLARDLSGIV